jgi:hypothetical protein
MPKLSDFIHEKLENIVPHNDSIMPDNMIPEFIKIMKSFGLWNEICKLWLLSSQSNVQALKLLLATIVAQLFVERTVII